MDRGGALPRKILHASGPLFQGRLHICWLKTEMKYVLIVSGSRLGLVVRVGESCLAPFSCLFFSLRGLSGAGARPPTTRLMERDGNQAVQ